MIPEISGGTSLAEHAKSQSRDATGGVAAGTADATGTTGTAGGANSQPKDLTEGEIADLQRKHPELEIKRKRKATPRQRVIIWIICSVIAALLPIIAVVVSIAINKQLLGFYQVTAKGDLLVIGAVLMVAGLAELFPILWRMPTGKEMNVVLIVIGMIFFVIADACWYGIILSRLPASGQPPGSGGVAYGSLAMYAVAAVLTSYCVRLSGGAE
jgi:hypothetical protein